MNGQGVRIAVLDTGIDSAHPDLAGRIDLRSSASLCISSALNDIHGHGTHVAGIIAGTGAASGGQLRGVASGAELIVFRVGMGMSALGNDVAAAVLQAVEAGADIINYSGGEFGYAAGPPPWKWPTRLGVRDRAFRYAAERGVLCVAAAGNDGPASGTVVRPGNLAEVLGVGALALPSHRVATASARGPLFVDDSLRGGVARADLYLDRASPSTKPDLVAPGGDEPEAGTGALRMLGIGTGGIVAPRASGGALLGVDPSWPDCPYARMAGTSQAAAVVTGLAALLLDLGRRKGFDWGDNVGAALGAILRASALRLAEGGRNDFGHGMLLWPGIAATLEDCAHSPVRRASVLFGSQLHLEG